MNSRRFGFSTGKHATSETAREAVVHRAYVPEVDLVGGAVLDELVNDVREGRVLVVVAPVAAGAGWCRPSTVTPALIPSRRTRNKAKLLQHRIKALAYFCRLVADSPGWFYS